MTVVVTTAGLTLSLTIYIQTSLWSCIALGISSLMVFIHFQELFTFVIQIRTGDSTGTQMVHQPPALLLAGPAIQGMPY